MTCAIETPAGPPTMLRKVRSSHENEPPYQIVFCEFSQNLFL